MVWVVFSTCQIVGITTITTTSKVTSKQMDDLEKKSIKQDLHPQKSAPLKISSQKGPDGADWLYSHLKICVRDVDVGALMLFSP